MQLATSMKIHCSLSRVACFSIVLIGALSISFIESSTKPIAVFLQLAEAEEATQQTRLRASSPVGRFETRRGATKIKQVDVKVKNVGDFAAKNVRVEITTPGGSTHRASGPTTLESRSEATYNAYPYEYVTSDKRLKAKVSCANCYR